MMMVVHKFIFFRMPHMALTSRIIVTFAIIQILIINPLSAAIDLNSMRPVDLSNSIRSLKHLFTKIRDRKTSSYDFREASKRIMHMICEESISYMDAQPVEIVTPTGSVYLGETVDVSNTVGVSIIRSGDSMLDVFLNIMPSASVGKMLIQRLSHICFIFSFSLFYVESY
jgi:uracil phosphoribosyltransferase